MKLTYTGKEKDFTKEQQKRLDARFDRLGKMVERKGEKKAHIVLKNTRYLCKAEITMNLHDHPLVGIGSDPEPFQAITIAAEKLEKQIHKVLEKQRESRRAPEVKKAKENGTLAAVAAAATEDEAEAIRVYRVKPAKAKPITLEEAMMSISDRKDYLVYRDADTESLSILIRRNDGHFDLVQA